MGVREQNVFVLLRIVKAAQAGNMVCSAMRFIVQKDILCLVGISEGVRRSVIG